MESKKNIETGIEEYGVGSAIWFIITLALVSYGTYNIAMLFDLDDMSGKACAVLGVLGYFAYLMFTSNSDIVVAANDKAGKAQLENERLQLEEAALRSQVAEMQPLSCALQLLQTELQTLKDEKQTAGENLRTVTDRNVLLSQSLESEMQARDRDKATADTALASAKLAGEQAVATAKANAKKSYAPALKVAEAYLSYAQGRSISNNNSLDTSARERGKEMAAIAKATLDEFVASASAKTATV